MQALVYKSTGNWYQLKNEQGRVLSARMAGKLKTEGITSSNPIAVGDNVTINDEAGEENLVITSVLPRKIISTGYLRTIKISILLLLPTWIKQFCLLP